MGGARARQVICTCPARIGRGYASRVTATCDRRQDGSIGVPLLKNSAEPMLISFKNRNVGPVADGELAFAKLLTCLWRANGY